ncbi:MAG: hypothetical protein M1820_008999 [Bogoriella megaspora]|nr:MAG: hypothetical protein M1820_008999 [Bogoriella megaspora]
MNTFDLWCSLYKHLPQISIILKHTLPILSHPFAQKFSRKTPTIRTDTYTQTLKFLHIFRTMCCPSSPPPPKRPTKSAPQPQMQVRNPQYAHLQHLERNHHTTYPSHPPPPHQQRRQPAARRPQPVARPSYSANRVSELEPNWDRARPRSPVSPIFEDSRWANRGTVRKPKEPSSEVAVPQRAQTRQVRPPQPQYIPYRPGAVAVPQRAKTKQVRPRDSMFDLYGAVESMPGSYGPFGKKQEGREEEGRG